MPASSRFRSESIAAGRPGSLLSPLPLRRPAALVLLAALLLAGLPWVALAAESGEAASLGDRIHQRFRVWVEDDSIRLRPIDADPALRSIELEDGDDEASVNGKAFSEEELRAFLGKDGELVAELLALDSEERRTVLGMGGDEAGSGDESNSRGEPGSGLPEPPEAPEAPEAPGAPHIRVESDGDDRVSFGRSIEIAAGESTGDAVCIGCSITVSGEVEGDAVAVGGTVHVESGGRVQGNAVGVGGKVRLESRATVEGDAVAVGGTVQIAEGATVEGQKSTVGWGEGWSGHKGDSWSFGAPFFFDSDFGELFWSILRALFLMLLCCLSVLLARGPMENTARRLTDEPWKAIFAGLLTQLLFFPVLIFVTVILAVSIVGIPLLVLVPVAILALLVATLLGFAAVAQALGRWAAQRFGWNLTEPFLPVVVGVAMIQGVTIVARLIGLPGGFLGLFAFALIALGFFLKYAAWTMGLGAMTLSLLGRDWRRPVSGPEGPGRIRRSTEVSAAEEGLAPAPYSPPPPPSAPDSGLASTTSHDDAPTAAPSDAPSDSMADAGTAATSPGEVRRRDVRIEGDDTEA